MYKILYSKQVLKELKELDNSTYKLKIVRLLRIGHRKEIYKKK